MESSKVFGGAEECHSSESGWTMYIGSCIDGENEDGTRTTHENSEDDGENDGHKDDHSDDSMVSDASSGPSHHHHVGERSRGHGLAVDKKAKKKPKEKQQPRAGRRKEEKKDKALLTHGKKR